MLPIRARDAVVSAKGVLTFSVSFGNALICRFKNDTLLVISLEHLRCASHIRVERALTGLRRCARQGAGSRVIYRGGRLQLPCCVSLHGIMDSSVVFWLCKVKPVLK